MSGGQDWAASVIRGDVDNPNLAHRIAVLRRELAEERRATESAVELLRVISDAYQAAKDVPHPLPGREIWISRDLWISISTFVALDDDRQKGDASSRICKQTANDKKSDRIPRGT